MADRVYLDWNASAPLRPLARAAMLAALDVANASSVHAEGRSSRALVESARIQVASLVGARPRDVIFTSGGTEANALALSPGLRPAGTRETCGRLLISTIEHPSVRSGGRFPPDRVEDVPVDGHGVVDLAALKRRLAALTAEGTKPLVSLMLANNETGVIQPVREAAAMVHEAGGLLHVDAVQGPGRIVCDINELAADLLTLSAHKIGGPKGVGALVLRADRVELGDPLLRGGGQERGRRAGTENVAGIVGFGAAAEAVVQSAPAEAGRMAMLRERLEAGLRSATPDVMIFGLGAVRLPNTVLAGLPGMKAETAVIALDLEGIAASAGAACSSGKVQSSHVLAAMGVEPGLARSSVRFSLGAMTAESEIDRAIEAWRRVSGSLLKSVKEIAA